MSRASQIAAWRRLATDLGIEVVTPVEIVFRDGAVLKATALVKDFGGNSGLVADPDWETLEPFARQLADEGYGYSAVEMGDYERDSAIAMLSDWTWTSMTREQPSWVRPPHLP